MANIEIRKVEQQLNHRLIFSVRVSADMDHMEFPIGIHVIEGETATPMLLARRFTLNPVIVVSSFVFWFWLWGVPGAILSAPILATTKIVCDRIRPLAALGHVLSG